MPLLLKVVRHVVSVICQVICYYSYWVGKMIPKRAPPYIGKVYWNLSCSDILVLYWTSPSRRARVVGSICTAVKDEDPLAETFSCKTKVSTFFSFSKVKYCSCTVSWFVLEVRSTKFVNFDCPRVHQRWSMVHRFAGWVHVIVNDCQPSFSFVNCMPFPRDNRKATISCTYSIFTLQWYSYYPCD